MMSQNPFAEAFFNRLTNIVTSSELTRRIIDWEQPDVDLNPPLPQGWVE